MDKPLTQREMKIERIIEILEKHQEWRRDQNVPPKTQMQSPIELGTAIDYAIEELKKLRTEDKEQTAVEYLLEYCARENWSIPFDVQHTAKEMEKKQMRLADMKEHTLQDVADDITGVIGSLAYFSESEALMVSDIQDRLEAIRTEIEETLD